MRNKFFKLILVAFLSSGLLGQANAGLIVDEIYEDVYGEEWQYVGSFDLTGGKLWSDPLNTPLNGLEAAASVFGLSLENLALSAFVGNQSSLGTIGAGDNVVNYMAWYDGNTDNISRYAEDEVADYLNDDAYTVSAPVDPDDRVDFSPRRDISAYVNDRALEGDYINYVFKAVEVPEPSMLGLFSLVLFGFSALRFKKT
jgi:hypothetical protein